MNVTSFSSISYYSNARFSKIELEQNFHSIILNIHASANERPPHPFQATQYKQISRHLLLLACLYYYIIMFKYIVRGVFNNICLTLFYNFKYIFIVLSVIYKL